MKFTPQGVKFLHSIDGVNYSLDFFFKESSHFTTIMTMIVSNYSTLKLKGPNSRRLIIFKLTDYLNLLTTISAK